MKTSLKTCFKCKAIKPLTEFYKHSRMADGHLNKCKDCTKKDVNTNRNENIDYYRAYDRDRYKNDEKRKQYIRSSLHQKTRKYPAMKKACALVNNAIRDGRLTKKPCEVCGDTKSEAHHPDYSKPLDVMWLCKSHHVKWHIKHGKGKNYDAII